MLLFPEPEIVVLRGDEEGSREACTVGRGMEGVSCAPPALGSEEGMCIHCMDDLALRESEMKLDCFCCGFSYRGEMLRAILASSVV